MAIPVKWNQTTARAGPAGEAARSDLMDPADSYADVAACKALDGPVVTYSSPAWRMFLAQRKADRQAGKVRQF